MAAPGEMSVSQLQRRIGLPDCPLVVDVRTPEDHTSDPRMVPTAMRRDWRTVAGWAPALAGRQVVVVCQHGLKLSQGSAAWLRHHGCDAAWLGGGFAAWRDEGAPLVRGVAAAGLPATPEGSVWVTRIRPKVDRIACPWLIRRFIDPSAVFLFVAAGEVTAVAERFGAQPFDIEGAHWSHRGDACTFEALLDDFGLEIPALRHLARIIRAADTGQMHLAEQAAGLLAYSLGLSRQYKDDLAQLEAGLSYYDAMFRWARDATEERHGWPGAAGATGGAR